MRNRFSIFLMPVFVMLFCAHAAVTAQGQTSLVFGPETFTRSTGQPQVITRTFTVQDPYQDYAIILRSGLNGEGTVTSAVIDLNGVRVAGPNDFNQQTGIIIKPVNLQPQNTISIELRGQPGTFLTVTIRAGSPPPTTQLTIINNRTDPLVLRAETADGKVIDYFGDKDSEGLVTSLYAVRVQNAVGEVTTIFLDDRSRPIRIESPDGAVLELTWLTDTSIALTATAPDGTQLDVPVDLTSQSANHHPASSVLGSLSLPNGRANYFAQASFFAPATLSSALTQARKSQGTSLVTVRRCAAPVNNANLRLEISDKKGFVESIPYKPLGNGAYSISVPAPDPGADRRLGDRLCFAIARVLNKLCTAVNNTGPASLVVLCPALTLGATLLGIPPPVFFFACNVGILALQDMCLATSLLEGQGPDGVDNIAAYLCQASRFVTNRITRGKQTLIVRATIPGVAGSQSNILGDPVNGTFPASTLVFPCQCASGYGKQFVVNNNNTEVKVTILPFEAVFTDEIRLFYRGQSRFIGTNRDVGRVVNLGRFNAGEELVFGIFVRETGRTFRMGSGFRNPDRYAHARVDCLSNGVKVSFEDNFLGQGDRDFDDAVFRITTSQ